MKWLSHIIIVFHLLSSGSSLLAKDSITVYLFLLDECRICQEIAPEINEIYKTYHSEGIGFLGVFPNFASKPQGIKAFKDKYHMDIPTKTDYFKKLTQKFDATVLPEVIVYNETIKKIQYRGLINDLFYAPGKRRHHINKHYLKDALEAHIHQKPLPVKVTIPIGCYINFNDLLIDN